MHTRSDAFARCRSTSTYPRVMPSASATSSPGGALHRASASSRPYAASCTAGSRSRRQSHALLGVRDQEVRRDAVVGALGLVDGLVGACEVMAAALVACGVDNDSREKRTCSATSTGSSPRRPIPAGTCRRRRARSRARPRGPIPRAARGRRGPLAPRGRRGRGWRGGRWMGSVAHLGEGCARPDGFTRRKKMRCRDIPRARRPTMADGGSANTNGRVIEVDDESFDAEVLASEIPVLATFGAPWCGPCNALDPIVQRLAAENAGRVRSSHLTGGRIAPHGQALRLSVASPPSWSFAAPANAPPATSGMTSKIVSGAPRRGVTFKAPSRPSCRRSAACSGRNPAGDRSRPR